MSPQPFEAIFKHHWQKLPKLLKQFYSVSEQQQNTQFSGELNITYKLWMWFLRPFNSLFGMVIPVPGKRVKITGALEATKQTNLFKFNRNYEYPYSGKKIRLHSNWEIDAHQRVTEFIGKRIGWRFTLSCDDEKVVLKHDAFLIKLFGYSIRLPLSSLVVGTGHAEQQPIDETKLSIKMTLTHFLFGEYYVYEGQLDVSK